MAFTNPPIEPVPANVALICTPPLDHSERNPVVRIMVDATFDAKAEDNVTEFNVVHELYDGAQFDRSKQYDHAVLTNKEGHKDWFWKGTWTKNIRVTMVGHLYQNNAGWFYDEAQFRDDRAINFVASPCRYRADDQTEEPREK